MNTEEMERALLLMMCGATAGNFDDARAHVASCKDCQESARRESPPPPSRDAND